MQQKTPSQNDNWEYVLESDRLIFRQLTPEDFKDLEQMLSDPKVMYAWEHIFTNEQIKDWIQNQLEYYRQDQVGYFAAISKDSQHFVGQMGLHRSELNGQHIFEVCYMLKYKYWHKGYALEGVKALTDYSFTKMGLRKVYACVKTSNEASEKVARMAGFTKEESFIKHYNGKDMEHFLYSKINA